VYGGDAAAQRVGLRWDVKKRQPPGLPPAVVAQLINGPVLPDWSFDLAGFLE
jgi:hypothetical protein